MTDTELREYEWETATRLLDADTTVGELQQHNQNAQHLRMRAQDEAIDRLVCGLADKTAIKQNLTGVHDFALRLHGRKIPPKLKQQAVHLLMAKYDE